MSPENVMVIGGSGFLGSHTADHLSAAGYNVVIFDKSPSCWISKDQKMLVGDILDPDCIKEAMRGCSIVYNFAGIADLNSARNRPLDTVQSNILGNVNILEACRYHKVERFLYASTIYVYSNSGGFYRCSKQACENYIEQYYASYGLEYTILRYGSLYGPRASAANGLTRVIEEAISTGIIRYNGDPNAMREFIHVSDAARSSVDALDEKFKNESVVLTGDRLLKVIDVLEMLAEIMGLKMSVEFIPGTQEEHYIRSPYSFSPKSGLKYSPSVHTDLGQGLLQAINDTATRVSHQTK